MNEKEKLKNLIVELHIMISEMPSVGKGMTIAGILDNRQGIEIVGAIELSHDSVELVRKLYERYEKEGQEFN